jgi:nanoRNase/pAp phosphatase (c-di-AMP/oligoRNAs hydrolase)
MEQVKVIDRVAFVVADSNISELGNKICETIDCDYCAIYTGQNISMRSVGNYDVSIIAKQNNGGGHKNASGMPCFGVEKVFELFKIKEIEEKALLNKKIQDIELKLIGITTENEALKQTIETMSTFIYTHDNK